MLCRTLITRLTITLFATATAVLHAAPPPVPTQADVSYGPHPHQIMDIHLPTEGKGPFPVLIWYGGLWQPSKHVPDLTRFLPKGIAVIGVETRTLTDGVEEQAAPPLLGLLPFVSCHSFVLFG